MDALLVYGSDDSDSDGDPQQSPQVEAPTVQSAAEPEREREHTVESHPSGQNSDSTGVAAAVTGVTVLPPPPGDLLPPARNLQESSHGGRIRSFPHVEGNYALHVYIPVTLPSYARNEVVPLIDNAKRRCHGLQLLEEGLSKQSTDEYGGTEIQQPWGTSGRLKLRGEYHVSLSRTVPIRIGQIESITSMLRHRLSSQKRYLVDFDSWEVFMNDEQTRTFLSVEITKGGLSEFQKQVTLVDEVFRLHNLPTFYKNSRPHISLAWALGNVTSSVQLVANELNKFSASQKSSGGRKAVLWSSQVRRVDCKVGQRLYTIWASPT